MSLCMCWAVRCAVVLHFWVGVIVGLTGVTFVVLMLEV